MAISVVKPTVGGSQDSWGTDLNAIIDTLVDTLNGASGTVAPDLSTLTINGTDVTATAAELNTLDGVTATAAELNTLDGVTATAAELNTASTHYVPTGGIIMWFGAIADIPAGWTLCDGIDHGDTVVPDLQDRFIVGAGSTYDVDDTGDGTATLTEANLPAHTHSSGTLGGTALSNGAHTHTIDGGSGAVSDFFGGSDANYGAGIGSAGISTNSNGAHTHTVDVNSGSTGSKGSGTAFDVIPKYYALAYIMKL